MTQLLLQKLKHCNKLTPNCFYATAAKLSFSITASAVTTENRLLNKRRDVSSILAHLKTHTIQWWRSSFGGHFKVRSNFVALCSKTSLVSHPRAHFGSRSYLLPPLPIVVILVRKSTIFAPISSSRSFQVSASSFSTSSFTSNLLHSGALTYNLDAVVHAEYFHLLPIRRPRIRTYFFCVKTIYIGRIFIGTFCTSP